MKTKYIKGIITMGFTATMLLFSSCLKDARYFDPGSVQSNLAELPLSGLQFFTQDAVTKSGIDTITFAVGVTAANPPSTSTAVTIGVDNTIITSYNAAHPGITYLPIPAASFKLPNTTVTIPAGQNFTLTTVIIDRTALDPASSYMLPIKIVSAGGLPISANFSIHYYHIIGNDFAGTYVQNFQRYNAADSTSVGLNSSSFTNKPATFSPVSPTEFTVATGYAGGIFVYDVTFKKDVSSGTPMYSNFAVTFTPGSISDGTGSGIAVTSGPVFLAPPAGSTIGGPPYTFANALKIFHFQFSAQTSAARYLIDTFHK